MDPPIAYTGAVTGYLIQSALYCEYRPYIEAKRQTRITPGLARRIARRTLETLKKIPSKGRAFARITLQGEIMGYPAIVSPDAVYFEDGEPKAVIRGRIRPSLRDYPGDWAVLALASLLLSQTTGKDTDTITLVLVLGTDKKALQQALKDIKINGPKPIKNKHYKIKTKIYSETEVLSQLSKPVKVLVGLEPPRPPSKYKCIKCPFKQECAQAQH